MKKGWGKTYPPQACTRAAVSPFPTGRLTLCTRVSHPTASANNKFRAVSTMNFPSASPSPSSSLSSNSSSSTITVTVASSSTRRLRLGDAVTDNIKNKLLRAFTNVLAMPLQSTSLKVRFTSSGSCKLDFTFNNDFLASSRLVKARQDKFGDSPLGAAKSLLKAGLAIHLASDATIPAAFGVTAAQFTRAVSYDKDALQQGPSLATPNVSFSPTTLPAPVRTPRTSPVVPVDYLSLAIGLGLGLGIGTCAAVGLVVWLATRAKGLQQAPESVVAAARVSG